MKLLAIIGGLLIHQGLAAGCGRPLAEPANDVIEIEDAVPANQEDQASLGGCAAD